VFFLKDTMEVKLLSRNEMFFGKVHMCFELEDESFQGVGQSF
jgi:hypothetical protein